MKYIFALLLLTLSLFAYIPPQITYGNDLIGNGSHTFLTDALGSTRGLVDNSGQLTDSYSYTPYGTLSSHKGTSENSFLFTGEQWDSETDNYYLRARYYDPAISRFLSRDTYDGKLNDPLSQNHYLYAGGNPVMYVDPSGHFFGGFASMSLSIMSTIVSGYPRIAGTVERGTVVAMYARAVVLGMQMRNDAINSIISSIMGRGVSQQTIDYAYDKYNYATQYISMVTGTIRDVDTVFTWTQATLGFAKGLTKIPLAHYSSAPSSYLAKTNSLNHMVITRLDQIIEDTIEYEKAMEILRDMTKLSWKIGYEIGR